MFKKLFKWLAIIIAIIAIIFLLCAAFAYLGFAAGATIAEFIPALSVLAGWGVAEFIIAGAIGLAVAFAIDGDAAGNVVASVGAAVSEAVSSVTDVVTDVIGDTASSAIKSIVSSPIFLVGALGLGAYLLLKDE